MKRVKHIMAALAVGLLAALPVFAGPLPAPENFTASAGATDVTFDWEDVLDATKYSVDVECTVTFTDDLGTQVVPVSLSYGTGDADGAIMSDSNLSVSVDALVADVLAQLTITGTLTELAIDGSASAKALDAGKGAGHQNNPFSNSASFELDITL